LAFDDGDIASERNPSTPIVDGTCERGLLSDDHFSVDGTQVAAWASMKSLRAKDGSDEPPSGGRTGQRDFQGERRETHQDSKAVRPGRQAGQRPLDTNGLGTTGIECSLPPAP
jgi:hypothetical protein